MNNRKLLLSISLLFAIQSTAQANEFLDAQKNTILGASVALKTITSNVLEPFVIIGKHSNNATYAQTYLDTEKTNTEALADKNSVAYRAGFVAPYLAGILLKDNVIKK